MVKLYLYLDEGERTIVESYQAQSFDDFVLITLDGSTCEEEEMIALHNNLSKAYGEEKKVLILDKRLDIGIYGVREAEADDS